MNTDKDTTMPVVPAMPDYEAAFDGLEDLTHNVALNARATLDIINEARDSRTKRGELIEAAAYAALGAATQAAELDTAWHATHSIGCAHYAAGHLSRPKRPDGLTPEVDASKANQTRLGRKPPSVEFNGRLWSLVRLSAIASELVEQTLDPGKAGVSAIHPSFKCFNLSENELENLHFIVGEVQQRILELQIHVIGGEEKPPV